MHVQMHSNPVASDECELLLPTVDHSGPHHSELWLESVGASQPQQNLDVGTLVASDRQLLSQNTTLNPTHDGLHMSSNSHRPHVMRTRAVDGIFKPKTLLSTRYPLP